MIEPAKKEPRAKEVERPLEDEVEAWLGEVRDEANNRPEIYLKDTEVPGGGE